MAKSLFFNLITQTGKKITRTDFLLNLEGKEFTFSSGEINNRYLIYPLSNNSYNLKIDDKNCLLAEHHIRIDKEYTNNNLNLTHYHYTATLKSKTNHVYTIHVYFNRQDQIIQTRCQLKLSKEEINLSKDMTNLVEKEAIKNTIPIIQALSDHYLTSLTKKQQDYEKEEEKLKQTSNSADYRKQLERIISIVIELQNNYFAPGANKLLNFFTELRNVLSMRNNSASPLSDENNEEDRQYESDDTTAEIKDLSKSITLGKEESLDSLIAKAKNAQEEYLLAQEKNSDTQVDDFLKFHAATVDAQNNILSKKNLKNTKHKALQDLTYLNSEVRQTGIKLLQNQLINDDFEKAKKLLNYIEYIAPKMVEFALVTKRPELLEFVLSHNKSVAINTLSIGKDKIPPALFCYRHCRDTHGTKDFTIAKCFSVLMKYNVYLLIADPNDKEHLPIAHHILSTQHRHPLHLELYKNLTKKLLLTLIHELEIRCKDKNLNTEIVKNNIAYYQYIQKHIEHGTHLAITQNEALLESLIDSGLSAQNKAIIKKVREGTEIQRAIAKLTDVTSRWTVRSFQTLRNFSEKFKPEKLKKEVQEIQKNQSQDCKNKVINESKYLFDLREFYKLAITQKEKEIEMMDWQDVLPTVIECERTKIRLKIDHISEEILQLENEKENLLWDDIFIEPENQNNSANNSTFFKKANIASAFYEDNSSHNNALPSPRTPELNSCL